MKKSTPVNNSQGIRNLCEVASVILKSMPVNAATTFAVRTVIREAVNKSSPSYKGNNNKRNVQFVSDAARPFLTSQGPTVSEHIIPISVLLNSKIYARAEPTIDTEGLIQLVAQYSTMALITNEEDARLRQAKLQSSMPEDWDGVDMFARYKAIGIVVSPIVAKDATYPED